MGFAMNHDIYEERKKYTFAQIEGAEELPRQLKREEISDELSAQLWAHIYGKLSSKLNTGYSRIEFDDRTLGFFKAKHVYYDNKLLDEFSNYHVDLIEDIKSVITSKNYVVVFDFLQWTLRETNYILIDPDELRYILEKTRAAFRLLDDNETFVPIATETELQALNDALTQLKQNSFKGAYQHLRQAADELTNGNWASSIRESVHAIESAARYFEDSTSLGEALQKIQAKHNMHAAMKEGFKKLYGFTSDENGIRHPLLENDQAAVDEVDAQFMLGACASFCSYLASRYRELDQAESNK